jgi:hypothetical protein
MDATPEVVNASVTTHRDVVRLLPAGGCDVAEAQPHRAVVFFHFHRQPCLPSAVIAAQACGVRAPLLTTNKVFIVHRPRLVYMM